MLRTFGQLLLFVVVTRPDHDGAHMSSLLGRCEELEMLQNKKLENPWRKHSNIPL